MPNNDTANNTGNPPNNQLSDALGRLASLPRIPVQHSAINFGALNPTMSLESKLQALLRAQAPQQSNSGLSLPYGLLQLQQQLNAAGPPPAMGLQQLATSLPNNFSPPRQNTTPPPPSLLSGPQAQTFEEQSVKGIRKSPELSYACIALKKPHHPNTFLEQEIELYRNLNQPVPHRLQILLAEAKRKQARKEAKRVANRRSASTSRARKKAFVEEITALNNHLKRQALILSLLPDLVIVVDEEANITFSSAQVERVLLHSTEDLSGTSLYSIVAPASKDKLRRLVQKLVKSGDSGKKPFPGEGGKGKPSGTMEENNAGQPGDDDQAMLVSDPSAPMSVVQVEQRETRNDGSDTSTSKQGSKATSSLTNGGTSDEAKKSGKTISSDNSSNEVAFAETKKEGKDAHGLELNVRLHNNMLKDLVRDKYTDDVTGEAVTANNADARLSSLQVRTESASETDSGYRESNESREETSSSASDSSSSGGRSKPLAPTCVVSLLRKDLSTIWCEVTSSVRSVEVLTEPQDTSSVDRISKSETSDPSDEIETDTREAAPQIREFLLCIRPIHDVDTKRNFKFVSTAKDVSASDSNNEKDSASASLSRSEESQEEPPRKRAKNSV